jgi:hypothetical protein
MALLLAVPASRLFFVRAHDAFLYHADARTLIAAAAAHFVTAAAAAHFVHEPLRVGCLAGSVPVLYYSAPFLMGVFLGADEV